jgi:ABC-type antimicrobial peptide transport system permease subunit
LSTLTVTLGVLALAIAMAGVYGIIAYLVSLGTREFGIRLALGARPGQVVRLVMDRCVNVVLVGLLAGVLVSTLLSELVAGWVVAVAPNPLALWFEVPALLLTLGLLAGYLPARRAACVDPNVALKSL